MIPQHYAIVEGKFYGGEYPGAETPAAAKAKLRGLIALGVRTFIDLTAPADKMAPYAELLEWLTAEAGVPLRRISFPLPDMGVPDEAATMRAILSAIRDAMVQAPAVYIHCWGGIGRTGMVVGCWLREGGCDPDAAVQRVQLLYSSQMEKVRIHPQSPQTREQRSYIRHWQPNPADCDPLTS